jgi:hypothetical protein
MARGITQEQVNTAADALLLAGERPTIERVRVALGTGSPNTLIRLLDVWWAALGDRLNTQARQLALPAAPDAVVEAASAFWVLALQHAGEQADARYADAQRQLAEAETAAEARVIEAISARDQAVQATVAADTARSAAEMRLTDLERLLAQQADQIDDLHRQRDGLAQERDQAQRQVTTLAEELRQQTVGIATERTRRDEQQRASEDRWLQEVDRARQETVVAQRERAHLEQSHRGALHTLTEQLEQSQRRAHELERRVVGSEARTAAQTQEVERLHQQLAARESLPRTRNTADATTRPSPRRRRKSDATS